MADAGSLTGLGNMQRDVTRAGRVALWLTTEPADHSVPVARVPMEPNGDGWAATFVPSVPGAWRVTIEATGLTGQVAPRVEDVIGVIDPDGSRRGGDGSAR